MGTAKAINQRNLLFLILRLMDVGKVFPQHQVRVEAIRSLYDLQMEGL